MKFVICGRRKPTVDRLWRNAIEVAELMPLELEHVLTYLERRGVNEADRQALAVMLFANSDGNMLEIANRVDGYLMMLERIEREAADKQ